MTRNAFGWLCLAGCLTLGLVGGCSQGSPFAAAGIESPQPDARVQAIAALVRVFDTDAPATTYVLLVDRLDDEDDAVRLFAIAALERLTGERRGYRPFDPREQRMVAVDRWRDWLSETAVMEDEQ